jgi:uncharacterized protein (DUF58 family)
MYIASYRKATHALEGEYVSLMRGRSMDFDDLREYAVGDDIKDIDWKASARHSSPLVKRYIANRKQPVIFVIDGGKNMNAITDSGEKKKDIAIDIMGILGYLTVRHSDTVGLIIGDMSTTVRMPNRESESHLERLLEKVNTQINKDSKDGDILKQLEHLANTVKTRGLVVVVSDEVELTSSFNATLRKLNAKHEVIWISVVDGNPLAQLGQGNDIVRDIETNELIPDYIRNNKKLKKLFEEAENTRKTTIDYYLRKVGISHASASNSDTLIPSLLKLLQRRVRERRR